MFCLICPTIWPQYTNVTDRQTGQADRQRSDSIGRTVLQNGRPKTIMRRLSRSDQWFTELWFYVPLNTKLVILETSRTDQWTCIKTRCSTTTSSCTHGSWCEEIPLIVQCWQQKYDFIWTKITQNSPRQEYITCPSVLRLFTKRKTSGYATWFTAGGAIRIAHYDIIDDVITRKL